ncbi:MAG: D-sedoheptulose 7-phosphate isomerase [Bacteroidetes bacterium]|nr:D-sedoheptulose 7-phosphate isomerase [Bacteroidota bacterium]
MEATFIIHAELKEAATVLQKFIDNKHNLSAIEKASKIIADAINNGGKIISCGNGGSHCDAMHFAEELTGRFRESRRPLPAIAISDPVHLSCTSNDYGFEFVFSRFIEALGKKADVLLAISTSGNSTNVINAIHEARVKGMKIIVLTGEDGGKMAGLADVELRVPHQRYADRIQEIHIKVIHILILLVEKMVD